MTTHRSRTRRAAVAAAAAVTAAAVLGACGGENVLSRGSGDIVAVAVRATPPPSSSTHNAADVSFSQQMISHHRQAVAMAELAAGRAFSPEVKALATRIKAEQGPEIGTMSGWLKTWGERVPGDMPGADHPGHDMPGMMSTEEMDRLSKASGKTFDTMFLQMMIAHHRGAVAMAGTERSTGSYPPAKDLAEAIIASQNKEIGQMESLLGAG
ncbi:DUF305 domain-containing protein [Streptosporangium sp. 'caverna']|uniref:DUF305 domain-containing protein n=1 Tax=Streptosporangium sp. 'caverna' TaxID=2202249 RepID=UPI000D7DC9F3|nr:DUF305 domain-containing protein [Streptosporangium sp. 'caverna']AWS41737.1 DUF305 domain-containing protein [Streptosporangium sp. 'caverna']